MNSRPIGKYLVVEEVQPSRPRKTKAWALRSASSGDLLGLIEWYGAWRQYVSQFTEGAVFNRECLTDIAAFLQSVRDERVEPVSV